MSKAQKVLVRITDLETNELLEEFHAWDHRADKPTVRIAMSIRNDIDNRFQTEDHEGF